MIEPQKDRLRTYAWNYFAYHADQRIKTFNFYLILVAVLVGGFGTAVSKTTEEYLPWLSIFGFLLTIVSVAFTLLDKRNRELVRNGEAALKHLDELESLPNDEPIPHVLKIFSRDDYVSSNKPKTLTSEVHISYSDVFRVIFIVFGLFGLISGIVCLLGIAS